MINIMSISSLSTPSKTAALLRLVSLCVIVVVSVTFFAKICKCEMKNTRLPREARFLLAL